MQTHAAVFLCLLLLGLLVVTTKLHDQHSFKWPVFDPQLVPIDRVDTHLPAVSQAHLRPAALRQRFEHPPVWLPELTVEKMYSDRPPLHAAVLLPIVMHARPTVLLTQRTQHLSTHSGQVAFPGGKVDVDDVDARATALREAQEEVGLDADFVQVLGVMPCYATGSGFIVTPVVALVEPGFTLTRNTQEVDDIFEVPLDFLMNPSHHRHHSVEFEGGRREWFSMPYSDPGLPPRFIWGVTAGILRNFYRLLSA